MVIQFVYHYMKCNMSHLDELQFIYLLRRICLLILQL